MGFHDRSPQQQWVEGLSNVSAGIADLKLGDLVYFQSADGTNSSPGHAAIVTSTNQATGIVTVIDAYDTGTVIRYDKFTYVNPGGQTSFAQRYFGALRRAT